jgi:NTE family protein
MDDLNKQLKLLQKQMKDYKKDSFFYMEDVLEHTPDNPNYKTVVLPGGSTRAISYLGVLYYLDKYDMMDNIKSFYGTSAGAIIAYLLAIGYTAYELVNVIFTSDFAEHLSSIDPIRGSQNRGFFSFSPIHNELEILTLNKLGYLPTMLDIKQKLGKTVCFTTYNLTKERVEYLSSESNPSLPCLAAIRMSCNIPIIFGRFQYYNDDYIDGGLYDNLPLLQAINGQPLLAINLISNRNSEDLDLISRYIHAAFTIPIKTLTEYRIKQASEECHIINVKINSLESFKFNISTQTKTKLLASGFNAAYYFYNPQWKKLKVKDNNEIQNKNNDKNKNENNDENKNKNNNENNKSENNNEDNKNTQENKNKNQDNDENKDEKIKINLKIEDLNHVLPITLNGNQGSIQDAKKRGRTKRSKSFS